MRIQSKSTKVRLECSIHKSGGDHFFGYTRNLSRDGVEIESNSLCLPGSKQPRSGDIALLRLSYIKKNILETVHIHARVLYVMGVTAGLEMFMTELSLAQRDDLLKIMETGSASIN